MSLLFLAAFILRIYKVAELPQGVWFDEAQNGNEVIRILEGGALEIFIPRFTQMPAMYFYIAAFLAKIFGIEIFALRLVSVILGSLSIVAFYFLLKYIFINWKLALIGAFLLAVSRWHITFSRVAFLGMQTLLLEIIFFYFYLKMIEEKRTAFAVIAGFVLGLSQYTFTAAGIVVFIVIFHMIILFLRDFRYFLKSLIYSPISLLEKPVEILI